MRIEKGAERRGEEEKTFFLQQRVTFKAPRPVTFRFQLVYFLHEAFLAACQYCVAHGGGGLLHLVGT